MSVASRNRLAEEGGGSRVGAEDREETPPFSKVFPTWISGLKSTSNSKRESLCL